MKSSKRNIGSQGELTAIRYLQEKGYEIIDTNYTIVGWEIDIIAKEADFFVFIEVRYRYDESYGHPLDTFSPTKKKSLKRVIMYYLMKNSLSPEQVRIDFIGLMPRKDGAPGHRLWHVKWVEI
jgi:putative endonuclease